MSEGLLLDGIESPEDLRALPREQVQQVTEELRSEIVERVSRTGGHLASSLGAVELITAIHYTFDTPRDRLVLDVGHQGYPHKMLTGRRRLFDAEGPGLGQEGGIGKFLRRAESECDHHVVDFFGCCTFGENFIKLIIGELSRLLCFL